MMGAVSAAAVTLGLTPALANAASSQTYFIGFPDWISIDAGATLPTDPLAINNAIVGAKDKDPLIAWGLDPVDLRPVFLQWYTPVNPLDPTDAGQDQYYTPGKWGVTGYETISYTGPNPVYREAYDAAYDLAYNYDAAYAVVFARISKAAYDEVYARESRNCGGGFGGTICRAAAVAKATQEAERVAKAQAPQAATAEATRIALEAARAAVRYIPETIEFSEEIPQLGWIENGYWSTTTSGQWVASPGDIAELPTAGQLAYLAYALEHGDLVALAPVLNWTAYLTNVNLIAYGDGAIAAGLAYQAFMDSVGGNTHEGYNPFEIGDPLTGPRKIRITFGDGVVQVHQTDTTNNPLEIPLPDDLEFPGAPPVGWESVQDGGVVDLTVLSLVLARNPGRANGGLYARFAPIYQELTGVNPVSPDRRDAFPEGVDPQLITKLLTGNAGGISFDELGNLQAVIDSVDGKPIVVTLKADIGWQYDLLSDAPVTANPFAWANSLASALFLTNLITGVDFDNLGDGGYVGPDGTIYYTLPVEELPLLAPLRFPAEVLGLATGLEVNPALADALEPALQILVNLGYSDVVRNPDGSYTRSLDQFGEHLLFGTPTLTREQLALVPGDVIAALGRGFGAEVTEILLDAKDDIVKALKLELTDEQNRVLEQALTALGNTIIKAGADAGVGISEVLTAIEKRLPEEPEVTQKELEDAQRAVGEQLANTRDQAAEVVDAVAGAVSGATNGRTPDADADEAESEDPASEGEHTSSRNTTPKVGEKPTPAVGTQDDRSAAEDGKADKPDKADRGERSSRDRDTRRGSNDD